jgi:hypothetical protein
VSATARLVYLHGCDCGPPGSNQLSGVVFTGPDSRPLSVSPSVASNPTRLLKARNGVAHVCRASRHHHSPTLTRSGQYHVRIVVHSKEGTEWMSPSTKTPCDVPPLMLEPSWSL